VNAASPHETGELPRPNPQVVLIVAWAIALLAAIPFMWVVATALFVPSARTAGAQLLNIHARAGAGLLLSRIACLSHIVLAAVLLASRSRFKAPAARWCWRVMLALSALCVLALALAPLAFPRL